MRLIDADELKKALAKNITIWTFNVSYDGILAEIIDNAPTVEPETKLVANVTFDKEQMEELVEKAKADILAQIERPQGKWIPCYVNFTDGSKPLFAYCKCSLCNKQATGVYKFCPNCGAEMGGQS